MNKNFINTQIKRVYQYRYVPDTTRVFYMTRKNEKSKYMMNLHNIKDNNKLINFQHFMSFYTEIFYSTERLEHENALMCYSNIDYATYKCKTLETYYNDCMILSMQLYDLKYYSSILRLPLLLEINSHCDILDTTEYIDAYYYKKKVYTHKDIFDDSITRE